MSDVLTRAPRYVDGESLARALESSGLDAVVVRSAKNVWYLSGHPRSLSSAQRPSGSAATLVVATRTGDPTLVSSWWHAGIARKVAWTGNVVTFRNYAESAFLAAARVLEDQGLARGTVGLEMDYIVDGDYRDLVGALPEATFRDLGPTIDDIRVRKSQEQLERSLNAFERLSQGIIAGLGRSRVGETRLALHNRIMRDVLSRGTDSVVGGIGTPDETIVPLVSTAAVPIAEGDVLILDYLCGFGPYAARLTRTVVVGGARQALQEAYSQQLQALRAGVEQIQPGMAASEACRRIQAAFSSVDMPCARPVVGYGLTQGLEDSPLISPDSADRLECGMEFVLDPHGAGGLRLSQRAVVTPDGVTMSDTGFPTDAPYVIEP